MDHYAVLGVPFDADMQTIHQAYRRLARKYHPDAGPGSSSDRFRVLTEAYQVLIDPAQRAAYDEALAPMPRPIPEPLSNRRSMRVAEPLFAGPKPRFHLMVYDQSQDPFAELDRIFEHLLRDFDEFFSYS